MIFTRSSDRGHNPSHQGLTGRMRRPRRRPVRPTLEALEARLVLAAAPLDPTFGASGVVLGPVLNAELSNTAVDAVAVQPDGKVVVVESSTSTTTPSLTVLRYAADGTVDTSFGTNGQANIPLPSQFSEFSLAPHNVVIAPDGAIVLAAGLSNPVTGTTALPPESSLVIRLTAAGQLDPSFGQAGEATVPLDNAIFGAVAVQADGAIVAAGEALVYDPVTAHNVTEDARGVATVVRLTAAGALDPSFNGTGTLSIPVVTSATATTPNNNFNFVTAVALTPGGQILVTGTSEDVVGGTVQAFLTRVTTAGTVDSTYGASGTVLFPPDPSFAAPTSDFSNPTDLAVQSDGAAVLVGTRANAAYGVTPTLARVLPGGTIDPAFIPPATSPVQDESLTRVAIGPDNTITASGYANPGVVQDLLVERFLASGAPDPGFGTNGRITFSVTPGQPATPLPTPTVLLESASALALSSTGQVVVAGIADMHGASLAIEGPNPGTQQTILARLLLTPTPRAVAGDYDGDGRTDVAAELAAFGLFAYRPSSGGADVVESFGPAGLGATIPAPGDYDGDGRTDIAAYLPALGAFAIRPSGGGADEILPFGIPGVGHSIPAPGDYDGDGRTDLAVYLPSLGILAYRPSSGGADVLVSFGSAGAGASIPAPGDYDGDGKTDPAVYLPAYGDFAYRPSAGGADVIVPFGVAGAGQTIPAPGDYDGDGRTDIAAYLPGQGVYAYRPSSGGADVVEAFGLAGTDGSIPVPGDYDGDGRTDMAVYLPALSLFVSRPSTGGADVVEPFGLTGVGQTVPAAALAAGPLAASAATVSAAAIPLTADSTDLEPTSRHRKTTHDHA